VLPRWISVEDDRTGLRRLLEEAERLVDLVEAEGATDHCIEPKLAGMDELRHAWEVPRRHTGAVPAPRDRPFLHREGQRVDRGAGIRRGHADQDRRASGRCRARRELDGRDPSQRLEREVSAPREDVSDRRLRILTRPEHRLRGAEPTGEVELRVDDVDRYDGPGAGDPGPLDHREADAPAADHDDRLTGPDACGVEHRSHAGHHGAPEQGHLLER
jgi:hypothetical protein